MFYLWLYPLHTEIAIFNVFRYLSFRIIYAAVTAFIIAFVLAGGAESGLQTLLKQCFDKVANVKPPASRSDSSEKFVVATGFRG